MPSRLAAWMNSRISPPGRPNIRVMPASRNVRARTAAQFGWLDMRAYYGAANALVRDANAVFEDGVALRRHRHLELRRPRRRLGGVVRRANHAPRSTERLVDFDADRDRLVVANRDLVLHLVDVRCDLLEIDLIPFADDVEGVADLEVQRLVLRRVVDAILADELHAALRILLIDANRAGRHRHPEAALLFVLE